MRAAWLAGVVLCFAATAHADTESPLSKLPFGIQLGKTKNKELAERGVCVDTIKVSDAYSRCAQYSMLGGKFTVLSSQEEKAQKVSFADGNDLPQAWKDIGLRLAPDSLKSADGAGTSEDEFVKIIKAQKAERASRSASSRRPMKTASQIT